MYADFALQQLQCNQQSNFIAGSNPYLWAVLLRIDDQGIATEYPVDPSAARLVIKENMKAGDTAVVPDQVAYLATHFGTDAARRILILITVLLDARDTPWAAMVAGYSAFLNATPVAVVTHLGELQDPVLRQGAIDEITIAVNNQVLSAIAAQLTTWDEIQIELGQEVPDRVINNAWKAWEGVGPASAGSFSLNFVHKTRDGVVTDDFVLGCRLVVSMDPPCEAQETAVRAVQQAIANIRGRAKEVINGQAHESPGQAEAELEQLEQELLQQEAKLAAAERALMKCRLKVPVGPDGPVRIGPAA